MKPEIKEEWVNALRSGEYEQGQRALHTDDGKFCCLGVLCDIYSKYKKTVVWEKNGQAFIILGCQSGLPPEVMAWSGIRSSDPYIKFDDRIHPISALNDESRADFKELADLIEAQL